MGEKVLQDFVGFEFDGIHSSELNIIRVSGGDRYKGNLHPEINDIVAEVAGKDGQYYFGSNYKERTLELEIAYDSLTEENFREVRKLFSQPGIHELIFDERPYKKYLVKLASPIALSFVCFDEQKRVEGKTIPQGGVRYKEGERIKEDITPWVYEVDEQGKPVMERIYKGEGTISFIAYYPFAKSLFNVLPSNKEIYTNISEWASSSGILEENRFNELGINRPIQDSEKWKIPLYNPGDVKTGCRIYFPFKKENGEPYDYSDLIIEYIPFFSASQPYEIIRMKDVEPLPWLNTYDIGFLINTDSGLIQGVESFTIEDNTNNPIIITSANIYGKYLLYGSFFKIEPSFREDDGGQLLIINGNEDIKIFYDYLYY